MGDEGRGPCLLAGPDLRCRLHLETLSTAAPMAWGGAPPAMGPATAEAQPAAPPAKEPARGREASHGVGRRGRRKGRSVCDYGHQIRPSPTSRRRPPELESSPSPRSRRRRRQRRSLTLTVFFFVSVVRSHDSTRCHAVSTPDLSIFFRKQKNCWACGTVGFDPWPPRAHGVRGATVFHVRLFPFYTDRSVEASVMSLKFSIIVEIQSVTLLAI